MRGDDIMRHPDSLSDDEIRKIAEAVLDDMRKRCGQEKADAFFLSNYAMCSELLKSTYIAVREALRQDAPAQRQEKFTNFVGG